MVERQVWPQAGGPSMGSKPLGVPLGSLVDHSSHCRQAALSQGMSCFFALCCDAAPSYLRTIGKSVGVTCARLRWGNIIAALTLLTRYWESVKRKWQGEQRKTAKEK